MFSGISSLVISASTWPGGLYHSASLLQEGLIEIS